MYSLGVLAELCDKIDEVFAVLDKYINGRLRPSLDSTLMSTMMKLNPAFESLRGIFEAKKPGDSEEYDILNLISGIITCSIPGGLERVL